MVGARPLRRRVEHGDWSVSSCAVCNLSDSRTCWSWPRACARTSTSRATAIRVPDCYMASPSRVRYRLEAQQALGCEFVGPRRPRVLPAVLQPLAHKDAVGILDGISLHAIDDLVDLREASLGEQVDGQSLRPPERT